MLVLGCTKCIITAGLKMRCIIYCSTLNNGYTAITGQRVEFINDAEETKM